MISGMKTIILSILIHLVLISPAFSQDSKEKASFNVTVTDFEGIPQPGEQVLFESKKTQKVFKGVSGKDGTFKIELPGDDTYTIKIKSVGKTEENTVLPIPALGPNEVYPEYSLTLKYKMSSTFTLDITFETAKANLTEGSYEALDEVVEMLKLKDHIKVEIAGHTDNVGDENANQKLSQVRANVVRDYLIKKGITGERIVAKGYGENQPVADNNTEEGRRLNRRTEVRVIE